MGRVVLYATDYAAAEAGDPEAIERLRRLEAMPSRMDEVLASGRFPGIKGTDAVFMEGRKLGGQQFEGLPAHMGREYVNVAERAGVNTAGKYYVGTIAEFPMDPRAWVSGLGDVKRVAEERGIGVTGAVNVAAPKYADGYVPPDRYKVADDIVEKHAAGLPPEQKAEVAKKLAGVKG